MLPIPLSVRVSNTQKDLKISAAGVRKLVRAVLEVECSSPSEVSICFVTERRICELHKQFFNDPSTTDCISFPIDSEVLGEIFVCPKTAIGYGSKRNIDPYEETALYIIHGLLHLLGHDDIEPKARRVMRKKEKRCMAHVKPLLKLLRPT